MIMNTRMTSSDKEYREFIFKLLNDLEPRREDRDQIIMVENQEVSEVLFFQTGNFHIGYELNNEPTFVVKNSMVNMLYDYSATFNHRSQWTY